MTATGDATVAAPTAADLRMDAAREFIARVRGLDRGELAALKRNAGNTLGEARGVPWFYRLLDEDGRRNPEIPFLVATLLGLNKHSASGDFGQSMHLLSFQHGAEAVDRRFRILLDSEFELVDGWKPAGGELAYRLRQMVKLAASREVGLDWAQLLLDLRRWNMPGKPVQRRWAESFYAPRHREPSATDSPGPAA